MCQCYFTALKSLSSITIHLVSHVRNANKIKINLEVAIIETKFDTKHCLVVDMNRNCADRAKSGGVWNLKSSYVATTGFKLCSSH